MSLSDRDRRWAAAVPALMLVVALVQMVLAHTADLSPWKGAGFGMFSTIDSVQARFLRVTGERGEEEEIPLPLPPALASEAAPIQTLPLDAWMAALADRLAAGTWVQIPVAEAMRRFQERRAQGLESPEESRALLELRETARMGSRRIQGSLPVARMLGPGERPERSEDELALDAIRVDLWRLRFDPDTALLFAEPMRSQRRVLQPGGGR